MADVYRETARERYSIEAAEAAEALLHEVTRATALRFLAAPNEGRE
jgi:hypothetical protein